MTTKLLFSTSPAKHAFKKLSLSLNLFLTLIIMLICSSAFSQIEPINMGQQSGFYEYYETLDEFGPKNHPGSGTKQQIVWKSSDNIFIYGNADYDQDYGSSAFWVYNLTIRQWKCIQPKNTELNYGTKGVFSASNSPGNRSESITFTDSSGNLFLMGGGPFNDLWKYDIALGQWAWISGYNDMDGAEGNYGSIGAESPLYFPAGRTKVKPITGTNGEIYIYGGTTAMNSSETHSDLWKYNPANNSWSLLYNRVIQYTYQSGQNITQVGVESANEHPGRLADYSSWFHDNSLYYFSGFYRQITSDDAFYNQVWRYNLSTQQWACLKNPSALQAVYGEQMVSAPLNTPPRLYNASNAVILNGEAYIMGGYQYVTNVPSAVGLHNNLWKYNIVTNEWTWMKGRPFINHPGFYGKKNIEREENLPTSHRNSYLWVENGNIKLYGGKTNAGNTIEFWNYNTSNNNFTWTDGKSRGFTEFSFSVDDTYTEDAAVASVYNKLDGGEVQWGNNGNKLWQLLPGSGMWEYDVTTSTNKMIIPYATDAGQYGQVGTPAADNIPPYRTGALLWETDDHLYLMSGKNSSHYFNDFWRFDKATLQWTWLKGSQGNATPYFQYGTVGESNSANYPKSRHQSQTWVDADQNLYLFSGLVNHATYLNDFWKYDSAANTWTWMGGGSETATVTLTFFTENYPPFTTQGACWSAGDQLYLYGGQGLGKGQTTPYVSVGLLSDIWKYSISNNTWTLVNGNRKCDNYANYGTMQYGFSSNLPGTRETKKYWSDDYGNLWLYGGLGQGEPGTSEGFLFDLWKYDITLNMWIWMDGPKNTHLYGDPFFAAYDFNLPFIGYDYSRAFKGNGKYYMFVKDLQSSLWEVDIAAYPGNYNGIEGYARYDETGDCGPDDVPVPNLKLQINDPDVQFYTNLQGYYKLYTPFENNVLESVGLVQNNIFNINPSNHAVNFTGFNNLETRNFCISPNIVTNDLDVTIVPLNDARPGFDTQYKIIYKNKGNVTLSGSLIFEFDSNMQSYVSTTVPTDSQTVGNLSWNYIDLIPFESRDITVTLNTNTPTGPQPVNAGDVVGIDCTINPTANDYTMADNTFSLRQEVVNSYDPNDKTCLEGTAITEDMVGNYLTYLIRFENNGTADAQNITVTDMIDTARFDIESIETIDSSHSYRMTVTDGNRVDFFFENINLPFDDANNDGYIAFRIKSAADLVPGDLISNSADIYFDYNYPVVTDSFVTEVQSALQTSDHTSERLIAYPNPVVTYLHLNSDNVTKATVYDISGRILRSVVVREGKIDLATLPAGVYVVKVFSDNGSQNFKIIKQ